MLKMSTCAVLCVCPCVSLFAHVEQGLQDAHFSGFPSLCRCIDTPVCTRLSGLYLCVQGDEHLECACGHA